MNYNKTIHYRNHAGECFEQAINVDMPISLYFLGPQVAVMGVAGHFTACFSRKIASEYIENNPDIISKDYKDFALFSIQTLSGALKYAIKYTTMLNGYAYAAKVVEGSINLAGYNLLSSLGQYASIPTEFTSGFLGTKLKEDLESGKGLESALDPAKNFANLQVGVMIAALIKFHEIVSPAEDALAKTIYDFFFEEDNDAKIIGDNQANEEL